MLLVNSRQERPHGDGPADGGFSGSAAIRLPSHISNALTAVNAPFGVNWSENPDNAAERLSTGVTSKTPVRPIVSGYSAARLNHVSEPGLIVRVLSLTTAPSVPCTLTRT